ncbi:MAG: glutathione-regulated potassium-efflux system protein KefC [Burkholderiaceae bacterium]
MEHSLLSNALVYLAAAVLAVPIASRFGLGAVLGYLIAGMAIGPWGLRLITQVGDILHFSEFGVVLLLFLIGLELEPSRLWTMRRQIFGWGGAQVLGVTAVLTIAAIALGVGWKTALIAALGLSLSSTAIAMATLEERNLTATPAGRAGFSILLFQDIAAIPMIAIVPLLGVAQAVDHGQPWHMVAARTVGVLAALVVAGRFLVRPVLRRIARTGLREIFTAFALLLVIAIALLMQWVGLSMALGTFLAGVLLADSEYRHALESDIEPFKGLLLGLFFIAVGMSVDFGVLAAQPLRVLELVAAFLVLKIVVLALLARAFDIPRGQQPFFAILLSQGGEFAFVVFGAAAAARVFSPETAALLVLAVAMSMVATPLLLLLHDRLIAPHLRAARRPDDRIDEQDNPVVIAGFGRFGQIVGRLLWANRIGLTVLDHDPDQIDLLRRFGFKVFYGDATRIDLLRTAGLARAKALVVAVDDVDASLNLVDAVRAEFPALTILARARNVTHYYNLMDRGVTILQRETFESALLMGEETLQVLGYGAYRARKAALKFRRHNLRTLEMLYPHYRNQQEMTSLAKQARDELEDMFARDAAAFDEEERPRWS